MKNNVYAKVGLILGVMVCAFSSAAYADDNQSADANLEGQIQQVQGQIDQANQDVVAIRKNVRDLERRSTEQQAYLREVLHRYQQHQTAADVVLHAYDQLASLRSTQAEVSQNLDRKEQALSDLKDQLADLTEQEGLANLASELGSSTSTMSCVSGNESPSSGTPADSGDPGQLTADDTSDSNTYSAGAAAVF